MQEQEININMADIDFETQLKASKLNASKLREKMKAKNNRLYLITALTILTAPIVIPISMVSCAVNSIITSCRRNT